MTTFLNWLQIANTIMTLAGACVAIFVALKVRELHVIVNSRLTELLKTTSIASRAQGDAEGTERERDRKS